MYYHIHLSDSNTGHTDTSGTNTIHSPQCVAGKTKLTWKLNDFPATQTFYEITKSAILSTGRTIYWNSYNTVPDTELFLPSLVRQLNADIDAYPLPNDLQIDINAGQEDLYKKTNEIHYKFEKLLVDSTPTTEQKHILERLNKLVHEIEHNIANYFDKLNTTEYFYACRHTSPEAEQLYKELSDEEYNSFTFQTESGDLYLDFFTVGKDLGHAYMSNDVALVKRKEVKQQQLITASIQMGVTSIENFGISNPEIDKQQQMNYYYWCKSNEVTKYGYDYKKPKYNLGRFKLGTLQNETYHSFIEKVNHYPYITDIGITDDKQN